MIKSKQMFLAVLGIVFIGSTTAHAEEPPASSDDLQLSQEVRSLLQAEMREIAVAVQAVAVSLATGNWESIETTSEDIRASYVME